MKHVKEPSLVEVLCFWVGTLTVLAFALVALDRIL